MDVVYPVAGAGGNLCGGAKKGGPVARPLGGEEEKREEWIK
jgi:hypothetical protein